MKLLTPLAEDGRFKAEVVLDRAYRHTRGNYPHGRNDADEVSNLWAQCILVALLLEVSPSPSPNRLTVAEAKSEHFRDGLLRGARELAVAA